MLQVRKAGERGMGYHGWLRSRHSFSFADYYDSQHMGFRSLRVINEDRIEGGTGFGAHPHRDMEIISYVVKGALEHKDSMGTKAIIRPGEIQRMSAGTGVVHSEFNHLADEETHFLQIWIVPNQKGGTPGYGQRSFVEQLSTGDLVLAVSGDGRQDSVAIKQDADLYIAQPPAGRTFRFPIRPGRGVWIQMVKGEIAVNDQLISTGDGLSFQDEQELKIEVREPSEFLLFDLA